MDLIVDIEELCWDHNNGEKASRFNKACRRWWKLPFRWSFPLQVSFFSSFIYFPSSSGACLLIWYAYSGPGIFKSVKEVSKVSGDYSCTSEVQTAVSLLKKAYGDGMRKVLHVGPETCSVVSTLLKEDETEAWGVEPYDIEDADSHCKSLVSKGLVRVADIKFPLPYRAKSFSLVIVSDALDYLSPKYLNKTVPELARVASDGLVLFAGLPGQQRAKVAELSKFGRPAKMRSASWWNRFFVQTSLEENEGPSKKFEQAVSKGSYKPACQVFHLKPLH